MLNFNQISHDANVMHNKTMDHPIPDIYAIRLANLEIILAELKKLTPPRGKVDIAAKMGKGQNYLSQVHSRNKDAELQPIGPNLARNIEPAVRELGLDWVLDKWMDVPHPPNDIGGLGPTPIRTPASKPAKVIEWDQAGGIEGMMILDESAGSGDEFVDAPATAGIGTFALRVRGDSMASPAGMPSYPAGCVIIVDPTKEPKSGSAVIVKLADTPEAVFKILELYDGKRHLKPLNPRYGGVVPMPVDARIVGVVVLMHYTPPDL